MSEALSSSEIEDVLSSIRRLVSDDLRPQPRGPQAAPEREKLLLTPALRVVQSGSEPKAPPAIDEVVAAVSAQVDATVDAQGQSWESETGDVALEAVESLAGEGWMLPDEAAAAPEAFQQDQAFEEETDALIRSIMPEAVPQQASIDGEVLSADVPGPADALTIIVEEAPLPGWAQTAEVDEEDSPQVESWGAATTVEPDRAWADEAEAAVREELAAETPEAAAQAPEPSADELIFTHRERDYPMDEAVLREIVRDVLREELQGRLGERITRNIRKLVRAEIARVMATDDFL